MKTNEYKPGETCICVKCDIRIPHRRGVPCREHTCPSCGRKMMREGGYHHQLYIEKKEKKDGGEE